MKLALTRNLEHLVELSHIEWSHFTIQDQSAPLQKKPPNMVVVISLPDVGVISSCFDSHLRVSRPAVFFSSASSSLKFYVTPVHLRSNEFPNGELFIGLFSAIL